MNAMNDRTRPWGEMKVYRENDKSGYRRYDLVDSVAEKAFAMQFARDHNGGLPVGYHWFTWSVDYTGVDAFTDIHTARTENGDTKVLRAPIAALTVVKVSEK